MSFDVDDFASNLDPSMTVEEAFNVAVLEAWRDSFRKASLLVEQVTHEDLCGWAVTENSKIRIAIENALSATGLDADQVSAILQRFKTTLAPSTEISDLLKKLSNLADDRGLEMLDLIAESRISISAVSLIKKNATKQGIHEPLCVAIINARTSDRVRAHRLKGGKAGEKSLSIRFDDTGRIFINSPGKGDRFSKDADIAVIVANEDGCKIYLCSHKFAREAGGHQDNQVKDSAKYLRSALKALESTGGKIDELAALVGLEDSSYEVVPALILDGAFFAEQIPKLREEFSDVAADFVIADTEDFISRLCH